MSKTQSELPRVLNASHATSIVVGIIIGSGIFLVPREMMAAVGSSGGVYAVWIVGGLLSLFGAMTYAEIAAARPRYGGEYAFLREAYGDLTGFLYMWTQITVAKPASLATIAAGLARVLGTFAVFGFFARPAFAHLFWGQIFAIAVTWLIAGLNIIGTRKSANVQLLLTWLKGLLILVIAGFCFGAAGHHGSWHNFATDFTGARGGFSGFMIALVAALWAYDGWSDVVTMAGEVERPQRSMPLALVGGVAIVGALYMLTNAAIQYVLPAAAIAAADRPAADAMRVVAGQAGSESGVDRNGRQHLCNLRRIVSFRSASAICCCSRWPLFQTAGACKFAVSNTLFGANTASCSKHSATAGDWKIPGALLSCHLRGVALLCTDRQHHLCLPPTRAECGAPLQHLGLSSASGPLHRCGGGSSGVFVCRSAT